MLLIVFIERAAAGFCPAILTGRGRGCCNSQRAPAIAENAANEYRTAIMALESVP